MEKKSKFIRSIFTYSSFGVLIALGSIYILLDLSFYQFATISLFLSLLILLLVLLMLSYYDEFLQDNYKVAKKNKLNAKIKLKNRQRNDMLSAIAHEFRNPISVIMGYAQTLTEDKEIDAKLRDRFLSKIYDNSQKIEAVLARLILWNKFESKSAKLETTNFNLCTLTKDIIAGLAEKYKSRKIIVNCDNSIVEADRLLLGIVIQNLIENGLKYSQEEVIVDIKANAISVTDRGVGINPKDIELITKKFYRSNTNDWDNSMGIGLSIVKQILKLHNSEIKVHSQEGIGSVFSFSIK